MSDNNAILKQELGRISDMLLLNGTLTASPGLVDGKMGVVIFFFYYARYTENVLYANYAMDLIVDIQEQLHANNRADYEKGIAGIGVGIDYLIRNDFLDAEDDIFEDLDQRMYRAVMYDPFPGFGLYEGLTGYGRYWILRLRQQPLSMQAKECLLYIMERIDEGFQDISQEEQTDVYCFLHDLHGQSGFDVSDEILERCRKQAMDMNPVFPRLGDSAMGQVVGMYQRNWYFNDALRDKVDLALKQIPELEIGKSPLAMGLLAGYAGEGLLRLSLLDLTKSSWMWLL